MVDIETLKPGDLVRLASGSPKMVVVKVRAENAGPGPGGQGARAVSKVADVLWYSDRLGVQKGTFAPELLVYPMPAQPRVADPAAAEDEAA